MGRASHTLLPVSIAAALFMVLWFSPVEAQLTKGHVLFWGLMSWPVSDQAPSASILPTFPVTSAGGIQEFGQWSF